MSAPTDRDIIAEFLAEPKGNGNAQDLLRYAVNAMRPFLIAFVLALFLSPAALVNITGQPRVIDGDTMVVAGQRIRLHGIDAPKSEQLCRRDGKRWRCGMDAT